MCVWLTLANCDFVMDILQSSYDDANSVLSADQKEFLSQFKAESENAGVDLVIDHDFVIPKGACQKTISTLLVKKHGKYSPDSKNPNGLAQFYKDYQIFIEGPCEAVKKDAFMADISLSIGALFDPKYFDLVKERPLLNDWVQKSRLCTKIYNQTETLVNSSYEYMVSQG